MCGNGVRMVARKLKMEGSIDGRHGDLETKAGEIVPTLVDDYQVRVDMGIARFGGEKLADFTGDAVDASLQRRRPQLHVHVRRRRQSARRHPVARGRSSSCRCTRSGP